MAVQVIDSPAQTALSAISLETLIVLASDPESSGNVHSLHTELSLGFKNLTVNDLAGGRFDP